MTETIEIIDNRNNAWRVDPAQIAAVQEIYNGFLVKLSPPLRTPSGPAATLRLKRRQGRQLRDQMIGRAARSPGQESLQLRAAPAVRDSSGSSGQGDDDISDQPADFPLLDRDAVLAALEPVKGISSGRAIAIWDKYGPAALDTIMADPAQVAGEVRGVSLAIAMRAAEHLRSILPGEAD